MAGIPSEAQDVREEDVKHAMPTDNVLTAWSEGREAEWPPDLDMNYDDDDDQQVEDVRPKLRFEVGVLLYCILFFGSCCFAVRQRILLILRY